MTKRSNPKGKPFCPDHPLRVMAGTPVNGCVVLWTCTVPGCSRIHFQEC